MILACPFCHARFLVPASLFSAGPRQMKCARCKHGWMDDGAEQGPDKQLPELAPRSRPPEPLSPEAATQPKLRRSYVTFVLLTIKAVPPVPPLVIRVMRITALFVAACLLLLWLATDRERISNRVPFLENIYGAIGLHVYHHGGVGLQFQQMRSELRYDSGITKLNLSGKIHNSTAKVQEIPDILATATGADGKPIQSWQIDAPAVRMMPGEDVDFHSSINAPRATVEDINLNFIERKENAPE